MENINLQSVLDQLVKEERDVAASILHKWFVDRCSQIHRTLVKESVEQTDDDAEQTDENLSPISGIQTADDDVDELILTPDELPEAGDNDPDPDDNEFPDDNETDVETPGDMGDEVGLEDRVDDLEQELQKLRAELQAAITGDEAPEEPEDDEAELSFEDLDESFELERVTPAKLDRPVYAADGGNAPQAEHKSLLPTHAPRDRIGGGPIETKVTEFTGHDREPSPTVKSGRLFKNQVKNAETALEKVPARGPKGSLLAKETPEDSKAESLMGGRNDLRGPRPF
jgi:hypothetical protein